MVAVTVPGRDSTSNGNRNSNSNGVNRNGVPREVHVRILSVFAWLPGDLVESLTPSNHKGLDAPIDLGTEALNPDDELTLHPI